MKIYSDKDTDIQQIRNETVAVIGLWKSGPCARAEPERERCAGRHRVA